MSAPASPRLERAPPPRPGAGTTPLRLAETGWLPDVLLRAAIRRLLRARLREIHAADPARSAAAAERFVESLPVAPIAPVPELANAQHYEVPAEFFGEVLGVHRKYSACLWPDGVETLGQAEEAMLELTCERAGVEDGMTLLDLGCGWGSLTGWLSEHYPASRILAVSNSRLQREFIESLRLPNVRVLTADANALELLVGLRRTAE